MESGGDMRLAEMLGGGGVAGPEPPPEEAEVVVAQGETRRVLGGAMKKTVHTAAEDADARPMPEWEVVLRYRGSLVEEVGADDAPPRLGKCFDDKYWDAPATFRLTPWEAPHTFFIDMLTITNLGESATYCLEPSAAFGEEGNDALGVPKDAHVAYEVVLEGVRQFERVGKPPFDPALGGTGVFKCVAKPSETWNRPSGMDEIELRLSVKWNDAVVYSTPESTTEVFKLSDGFPSERKLQGLSMLLESMSEGETAEAKLSADVAFGAKGYEAWGVPADAPLVLMVELVTTLDVREIYGDDRKEWDVPVVKKRLSGDRKCYDRPADHGAVELHFSRVELLSVSRERVDTLYDCGDGAPRSISVVIDSEPATVAFGIELALVKSTVGERIELTVPHPAHTSACPFLEEAGGEAALYPKGAAHVRYTFTLHAMSDTGFEPYKAGIEPRDCIKMAEAKRNDGKAAFARGDTKLALHRYSKMHEYAESAGRKWTPNHSEEDRNDLNELVLVSSGNLALCHQKLKQYREGLKAIEKALKVKPLHAKSLFRRARLHAALHSYDDAVEDLKSALNLEANNKEIRAELDRVRKLRKASDDKQKKTYANMFERMEKIEAQEPGYVPPTRLERALRCIFSTYYRRIERPLKALLAMLQSKEAGGAAAPKS